MLGWAPWRFTLPTVTSIPSSRATSKAWGSLGSSGAIPKSPAVNALSVPWPRPVAAKEPWSRISALAGVLPSSRRAMRPSRAAPAVWEEEGPIIMGPIISKIVIGQHPFPMVFLSLSYHSFPTLKNPFSLFLFFFVHFSS